MVILLPLSSGRWAIFNAARILERVVVFPDAFDLKVKAVVRHNYAPDLTPGKIKFTPSTLDLDL